MGSIDLNQLQSRARRAYEFARVRRALLGVIPVALIVLMAAWFVPRPASTLAFGIATVVLSAAMLWFGRDPQKAVLPGLSAGLVPLVLTLGANQLHACRVEGCTSICAMACALGGAAAGLAIASVGHARQAGPWFWISASGVALLFGAAGSACIGLNGVLGLALGFGIGMALKLVPRALAS